MLHFNIRRIMKLRGIDKPYAFLVKNGFVGQTATNMINNQLGRITPQQMEKLCLILYCTPNDLFEWQPQANSANAESHPLRALIREKPAANFSELVKDLPVEKMSELEEIIKNLKNSE